jgi:hypothetical protein
MQIRRLALCAAFLLSAAPASAQAVKLEFNDGRVTLVAQNAPLRTILSEWARLGGAQIVNADKVSTAPVTIELKGEPERRALDILLRGVAGYMIAARELPRAGASAFDRIMILPTSTAPRPSAAPAAATFAPPPPPPVAFGGDDSLDDVDDAVAGAPEDAVRRAQEQLRRRVDQAREAFERAQENQPAPGRVTGQPVFPGAATPGVVTTTPGAPPSFFPAPQAPTNTQRTPSTPFNPFMPTTGSPRPGEVTPAPPQQQPTNRDQDER